MWPRFVNGEWLDGLATAGEGRGANMVGYASKVRSISTHAIILNLKTISGVSGRWLCFVCLLVNTTAPHWWRRALSDYNLLSVADCHYPLLLRSPHDSLLLNPSCLRSKARPRVQQQRSASNAMGSLLERICYPRTPESDVDLHLQVFKRPNSRKLHRDALDANSRLASHGSPSASLLDPFQHSLAPSV